MILSKTLILLCYVFILALADERHECQKEHHITLKDMELSVDELSISEKVLCYMKCAFDKKGAFDKGKRINMEIMNLILDEWAHLNDKGKSYAIPCLQELGTMETCFDVKPIHLCIENGRESLKKCQCLSRNVDINEEEFTISCLLNRFTQLIEIYRYI